MSVNWKTLKCTEMQKPKYGNRSMETEVWRQSHLSGMDPGSSNSSNCQIEWQKIPNLATSVDSLLTLRDMVFCEAAERALITPGEQLVGRRITRGGKPLNEKLADDMWTLIQCLKKSTTHPPLISEKREV